LARCDDRRRRGELVALRWSNFELERGLLRVGSSYVVRSGQRRLNGTKIGDERLLSLDSVSVELLTQFRATREAGLAPVGLAFAADAFVFSPDPAGAAPWHPDHFTHAYRQVANSLDITEPLKNLRHFNATQLLAAGVALRRPLAASATATAARPRCACRRAGPSLLISERPRCWLEGRLTHRGRPSPRRRRGSGARRR
jgi:integrase